MTADASSQYPIRTTRFGAAISFRPIAEPITHDTAEPIKASCPSQLAKHASQQSASHSQNFTAFRGMATDQFPHDCDNRRTGFQKQCGCDCARGLLADEKKQAHQEQHEKSHRKHLHEFTERTKPQRLLPPRGISENSRRTDQKAVKHQGNRIDSGVAAEQKARNKERTAPAYNRQQGQPETDQFGILGKQSHNP